MAKPHDEIGPELEAFIQAQEMFFVASAPLDASGHVNVSPKGLDTFRVLSPKRVAYLDLTGSGNETAAHMLENGRITLMFCAFEGGPKIVRLYGQGSLVLPSHAAWTQLLPLFPDIPGIRQIIVCEVERVQSSCGFAVPLYEYVGQRDELTKHAIKKGPEGLIEYRYRKNRRSIDGLPAPVEGSMK